MESLRFNALVLRMSQPSSDTSECVAAGLRWAATQLRLRLVLCTLRSPASPTARQGGMETERTAIFIRGDASSIRLKSETNLDVVAFAA
jgi:hypothetical protein